MLLALSWSTAFHSRTARRRWRPSRRRRSPGRASTPARARAVDRLLAAARATATMMRLLAERVQSRGHDRRRRRLGRRLPGGGGLGLSGGALPAGPADHVSRHDRGAEPMTGGVRADPIPHWRRTRADTSAYSSSLSSSASGCGSGRGRSAFPSVQALAGADVRVPARVRVPCYARGPVRTGPSGRRGSCQRRSPSSSVLFSKKWLAPGTISCVILMPRWIFSFDRPFPQPKPSVRRDPVRR